MPDTMIPEQTDAAPPTWEVTARSPQLGELFAAVAKAQGEIEGAKKDSTNPHFKSKYADLASARDAVQGPLSKNGLALIQWPRTVNNGVEIETWLGHSSGQYMSGTLCMPCGKMDAHGVGSAITYGRRYALMAVTGVAPEDDDGNDAVTAHRGTVGMASGGGEFRPARRQAEPPKERTVFVGSPQTGGTDDYIPEEDKHLLKNGETRSTYQIATADKSSGRLAAELWASQAVTLFKQPGYSLLDYKEWKNTPCTNKGTKTNDDRLVEMREKHPDLAQKIDDAVSNLKVAVSV